MLSLSIALLISIVGILILLRLKVHTSLAVFVGGLIVSLLVLPLSSTPTLMLQALLDYQTLRLLVIIVSALTISRLMEEKGLLTKLATAMESISPKLALHFIPAMIGLVPMPAGALVSATTSRDLSERVGLNAEQSTFVNYWFRHIWEFFLPVYPMIITISVLLSIPLSVVVATMSPMAALYILLGTAISYGIMKKLPRIRGKPSGKIAYNLFRGSWPILLLVPLILFGLEAMIAFPFTLIILTIQQRTKWAELKKVLVYGLDPKILFLIYAIMLYKTIIESSGAALALFSDMQAIGLPALVILFALPFLIGFATGIGIAFVGVTFPLLVPYMILDSGANNYALLLAYTSGLVGVLMSPLHLCLVMSAEYFKANLIRMYKYILPPLLGLVAIAILVYYITA